MYVGLGCVCLLFFWFFLNGFGEVVFRLVSFVVVCWIFCLEFWVRVGWGDGLFDVFLEVVWSWVGLRVYIVKYVKWSIEFLVLVDVCIFNFVDVKVGIWGFLFWCLVIYEIRLFCWKFELNCLFIRLRKDCNNFCV